MMTVELGTSQWRITASDRLAVFSCLYGGRRVAVTPRPVHSRFHLLPLGRPGSHPSGAFQRPCGRRGMTSRIDISGQRFGRLVVIGEAPRIGPDLASRVRCDCGTTKIIRNASLRYGRSQSCGCITREIAEQKNLRHGATTGGGMTPEYRSYKSMRERCLNPNHRHYANYGGRGITICDRWLEAFENFLEDMGQRPSLAHTLDREDNDGFYSPDNCRWLLRKDQNRNTRVTRSVKRSDGKTYRTAGEAGEDVGATEGAVRYACSKPGKGCRGYTWRFSEALENNAGRAA